MLKPVIFVQQHIRRIYSLKTMSVMEMEKLITCHKEYVSDENLVDAKTCVKNSKII